jgi:hypothetical protein
VTIHPHALVVSSTALSVALIVAAFALDDRDPSLYEPLGKIGVVLLFCIPYGTSLAFLAVHTSFAFKFAKWLSILVLAPLVPYLLLITLFAGWAFYPLGYALMVLFALTQAAIVWGTLRASPS